MKNQEDFLIGVGDELVGSESPLLKLSAEREWLQKVGMEGITMEEFIKSAEEESLEFRRGLKEAMMEGGTKEEVVDGMMKEAETILVEYMKGLERESNPLTKTAFLGRLINPLMRGLKQPVLQGLAASRGFLGSGAKATMKPDLAVNRMIRKMAPGLPATGKAVGEVHRGTLRMGLGNWLDQRGMGGLGNMLQNSGQRAMQGQATRVNERMFRDNFNNLAGQASQASRSAGGITPSVKAELDRVKNMRVGNRNSIPGAVPAQTVEQAKMQASNIMRNPATAQKLTAGGGIGGGTGHVRFTPGKGATRGLMGAGIGGLVGGPIGATLGGLGGLTTGTLGTGGTALAAGGLYGASKLFGGGGSNLDETGLPADRNRVLPMMGNNWTGAAGGALLASIIGNQMGLTGPMSWLLPLLGGAAGYKFLPGLINSWSDPKGMGVNAIPMAQRPPGLGA